MAARRYLRYRLSYQDLFEMLSERGVHVNRSTVYRIEEICCERIRFTVPPIGSESNHYMGDPVQ